MLVGAETEDVEVEMEERRKKESHSNEDDDEIQKKKYEDIWRQASLLRYVALSLP